MPFVPIHRTAMLVLSIFIFIVSGYAQNNIGIGTTNPNSKAILDISSTNRGILIPRMSNDQRIAITNPPRGLLVFVNTDSSYYYYDGSKWANLSIPNRIADADGNTGIFAEKNANEDQLRFQIGGTENMRLVKNSNGFTRLELANGNGTSLGIGLGALEKFDGANNGGNTVVGIDAGRKITGGRENSFYGYGAGENTTTSIGNTFIGRLAGKTNEVGAQNTYIGKSAGFSSQGNENVFIGSDAGDGVNNGSQNTGVGRNAGRFSEGNANTFLGFNAQVSEQGLNNATAIGANSRVACSNCIVLGPDGTNMVNVGIGTSNPFFKLDVRDDGTASDSAFIGIGQKNLSSYLRLFGGSQSTPDPYILFTGGRSLRFIADGGGGYNERLTIAPNGNIGINKSSPDFKLDVNGNLKLNAGTGAALNIAGGGDIVIENDAANGSNLLYSGVNGGGTGTYKAIFNIVSDDKIFAFSGTGGTVTSDARLKQDIEVIDNSLDKILQLNGYSYRFISKAAIPQKELGVLAQEVRDVLPELVSTHNDGSFGVSYNGLVPVLINAVKEQQKTIVSQEERITAQEERLTKLEALLKAISAKK